MASLTKEQLREGSKHVVYEWEMLLRLANLLRNPPSIASDSAHQALVEFACLEAFLIHGRQLAIFFHEDRAPKKPTDLCASYYVPNWSSISHSWTPSLQALKDEADKRVAHLTTHRYDDARRAVQQWAFELGQHIRAFEEAVSTDLFDAKRTTPMPTVAFANDGVTTTNSRTFAEILIRSL